MVELSKFYGGEVTHFSDHAPIGHYEPILSSFFKTLSESTIRVLLLDYDGTLAPFQADPSKAVPYPGVRELLERILAECNTRIVFISGRPPAQVDTLLGMKNPEIWGSHGMQCLKDGKLQTFPLDDTATNSLAAVAESLTAAQLGDVVESKPTGYAVHWRGLSPDHASALQEKAEEVWAGLHDRSGLRRLNFDGGLEICVDAMTKGDAVRRILDDLPSPYVVAYLGDDLTDEDAFRVLNGHGLGVLVRETYRETAARVWIQPPSGLIAFLERWITHCGGSFENLS